METIESGLSVSGGIVKHPNVPYARASHSTSVAGGSYIPLNVLRANRGFTISGSRFNIPHTGLYLVGYSALGNSGSGSLQMEIRVNGVAVPGTSINETSSANDSASLMVPLLLNQNDYVEFYVKLGTSHANADYNSFWIIFLGNIF